MYENSKKASFTLQGGGVCATNDRTGTIRSFCHNGIERKIREDTLVHGGCEL